MADWQFMTLFNLFLLLGFIRLYLWWRRIIWVNEARATKEFNDGYFECKQDCASPVLGVIAAQQVLEHNKTHAPFSLRWFGYACAMADIMKVSRPKPWHKDRLHKFLTAVIYLGLSLIVLSAAYILIFE